jgi:hypothetical protein
MNSKFIRKLGQRALDVGPTPSPLSVDRLESAARPDRSDPNSKARIQKGASIHAER